MSGNHTPGPWRFERSWVVADTAPEGRPFDSKEPEFYQADGRGGYVIAETVTAENGPLLAAAPELLTVLEQLATACDVNHDGHADTGCSVCIASTKALRLIERLHTAEAV